MTRSPAIGAEHRRRLLRGLLFSAGAFVLQGAWAMFANWSHGFVVSARAGAVQGACSFGMTYMVTVLMECVLAAVAGWPRPTRFGVTFVAAVSAMLAVQISAHWLAGTPHILLTIAPAASIGTVYCGIYTFARTLGPRSAGPTRHSPSAVREGVQG